MISEKVIGLELQILCGPALVRSFVVGHPGCRTPTGPRRRCQSCETFVCDSFGRSLVGRSSSRVSRAEDYSSRLWNAGGAVAAGAEPPSTAPVKRNVVEAWAKGANLMPRGA